MTNEAMQHATSSDVNVIEEIDKLIGCIKELYANETNEDRLFELSVLRYVLAKHKEESPTEAWIFIDGLTFGCPCELMSEDNIELLNSVGWTALERFDSDYESRTEYISYMLVARGGVIPKLATQTEEPLDYSGWFLCKK